MKTIDTEIYTIVDIWKKQEGYKEEDDEAMDGDAVDLLVDVIRDKINLYQGNITQREYEEKYAE